MPGLIYQITNRLLQRPRFADKAGLAQDLQRVIGLRKIRGRRSWTPHRLPHQRPGDR